MKKLIITLCAVIGIVSCTNKPSTKQFTAVIHNGMNLSEIECDSFKMISKTQAITYNNGKAMPIVGDEIRVHSNN